MIAASSDTLYDLYGLTLQSEIPLPARLARGWRDPDHSIAWGDRRPITTDPAPGNIVTRWCLTETFGATVAQNADGYIFRIHGVCEFEISGDLHPESSSIPCRLSSRMSFDPTR